MFDVCEKLDVRYTFGIWLNNVLKWKRDETLDKAVVLQESDQRPQRLFRSFQYRTGTWSNSRLAIVKCEVNAQGTNRRAVIMNCPGA